MANKTVVFVALAVLLDLCIGLAPSIVWLVYGVRYLNDPCNVMAGTSPTLAQYLIATGAVGVGTLGINVIFTTMILLKCCKGFAVMGAFVWGFVSLLAIPFNLAWVIIGEVRITDDIACRSTNETLYNVALACNIVSWFSLGFAIKNAFTVNKKKDEDD